MTEELAKLLDGPVAERFGRPTNPCSLDLNLYSTGWSFDVESFDEYDTTAEALWLAHLLAVCGEHRWCVHLWDAIEGKALAEACVSDWTNSHFDYEDKGETLLAALASAMLSVPEVK